MRRLFQLVVGALAITAIVAGLIVVMAPVQQVEAQSMLKGEFSLAVPIYFCYCPSEHNACPCPPPGG